MILLHLNSPKERRWENAILPSSVNVTIAHQCIEMDENQIEIVQTDYY